MQNGVGNVFFHIKKHVLSNLGRKKQRTKGTKWQKALHQPLSAPFSRAESGFCLKKDFFGHISLKPEVSAIILWQPFWPSDNSTDDIFRLFLGQKLKKL